MRSLFILVILVFSGTFFAESTMQCNIETELGEELDEKISAVNCNSCGNSNTVLMFTISVPENYEKKKAPSDLQVAS